MTDCSSIQGSTTSSSSDVTTLTTTSSWCAISPSSRIRVIRLIRPHPRRLLVTPGSSPSFGFAIRGGKEFGTGFFISSVERYSEADQRGLRVGDQVLRVNGYRVDDAVHRELIQFITSQDRLTLKVRGIGMLPMKDKENDPLTWHVVKPAYSASLCAEDPFKSIIESRNNNRRKDVRIVLNVAPRTKLGLGICKGPEWKPGIFIQFTKDKSVAREAGLRPGDQILCVNSIDFSDVLFSEAVAVMKSSTKLDMVVRTAAGCDLFPGESSGYNSSASSVTGDQSPCWADVSAKRLTVVREETSSTNHPDPPIYADAQRLSRAMDEYKNSSSSDTGTLKEVNKTIIKLSENGTSINNTYISDPEAPTKPMQNPPPNLEGSTTTAREAKPKFDQDASTPMPPPPPPFATNAETTSGEGAPSSGQKVADICFVSRQSETKTVIVEVHRNDAGQKKSQQLRFVSPDSQNTATPPSDRGDGTDGGSTLCSAIAQELKKRKEKLRPPSEGGANETRLGSPGPRSNSVASVENMYTAVKARKKPSNPSNGSERQGSDQHSALMDEFKRAHQRMFKNGFQETDDCKERQDALRNTIIMDDHQSGDLKRTPDDKHSNGFGENGNMVVPASPPLQFADRKPRSFEPIEMAGSTPQRSTAVSNRLSSRAELKKPPDSPTPDYDNVHDRGNIPKKQQTTKPLNANHVSGGGFVTNRRTMRLGTVTIGEYEGNLNQRKEPGKFDFLAQKGSAADDRSERDALSLRTELQDTLSRSNLRKTTSPNANVPMEHQSHCLQHNTGFGGQQLASLVDENEKEYTNVEKLTRLLQCRQTQSEVYGRPSSYTTGRKATGEAQGTVEDGRMRPEHPGTGILKNGSSSRNSRSSLSRNSEKSISFGN